jgi:UDP-glucuronate decarboxylase
MTSVVAGGAGFIGSHLCEHLLEDGREVVCIDNCSSGRAENLEGFRSHERFTFVEGNILDGIETILRQGNCDPASVDRLYHLASRASPVDFRDHPLDIARVNSEGTRLILEFCAETGARALFASTSEVYGDPEVHPQHEEYYGNVNPRGPRACYDEGKRFGEMLAAVYHRQYDVDVRTVRLFNTYGPRMRADDGRVIPTFVTQALVGEDLTVYGDGQQTRSFLYVSDLCQGLTETMDRGGLDGQVLNLGSTSEVTIESLAENIISLVDTESDITYEPLPEDDPQRRRPNIDRARRFIDWEPKVKFEDGFKRTINYFRS